jgi:glycosyltransferase involved in cell wall biosynthesis
MNIDDGQKTPDLSIIMPCYNEEAVIEYTIPRLIKAFESCGHHLELVAVDNGSYDRTGDIIHDLAAQYPSVVPGRVVENEGYGWGVLNGIPLCTAPWIGIIPADGQVDAEDVVRLYEAVASADGKILGKVRRRFRMDGVRRKVVSVLYNLLVRILWPGMASWDINGSPKLLPRRAVEAMDLKSRGWLLDPEIMIKAHYLGIRVLELNVFARMRGSGVSHVKPTTVWEFLRYLLHFRFSRAWQEDLAQALGAWERANAGADAATSESRAAPRSRVT